jgi:solute carrier family 10 (sodium/bile acid cotransporter), member 7
MGLKTDEFAKATKRLYFNGYVQSFSFFFISGSVYGISQVLAASGAIAKNLADGMVICSCMPATVNMVTVLTRLANGDEAVAVFNCAFSNFMGIFLSPVLILLYLGVTEDLNYFELFYQLALRILTPILAGQILQRNSKAVVRFVKSHRTLFKKGQQYLLVYIVYCVFCKSFKKKAEKGAQSDFLSIFIMIVLQGLFLLSFMTITWYATDVFFPDQPKLRVMAVFGCTHKSVSELVGKMPMDFSLRRDGEGGINTI